MGKITTYEPITTNNNMFYVYGTVRASLTTSITHKIWILFQKTTFQIKRICRCSCMAGTNQSCNHAIAVMYKMEYAVRKCYMGPTCTSMPYKWKQSTNFFFLQQEGINNWKRGKIIINRSYFIKYHKLSSDHNQFASNKVRFAPDEIRCLRVTNYRRNG